MLHSATLTFPCMSSLIVKVTLSPPSTILVSIAAAESTIQAGQLTWSLVSGWTSAIEETRGWLSDRCCCLWRGDLISGLCLLKMLLSLPHHEVLQTVHMVQGPASERCTLATLTIHSERMGRFSSVIHIRLAPIHSFTAAQWATVSLRQGLFPGEMRLWRAKHVTLFWNA